MSKPQFLLVKKKPVVFTRREPSRYVNGRLVPGAEVQLTIEANIHPFSDYQVSIMPEADRTKDWLWVFSAEELRLKKEGPNGHGADTFEWLGDTYEIMKVAQYDMGILDSFQCKAAKIGPTPN